MLHARCVVVFGRLASLACRLLFEDEGLSVDNLAAVDVVDEAAAVADDIVAFREGEGILVVLDDVGYGVVGVNGEVCETGDSVLEGDVDSHVIYLVLFVFVVVLQLLFCCAWLVERVP